MIRRSNDRAERAARIGQRLQQSQAGQRSLSRLPGAGSEATRFREPQRQGRTTKFDLRGGGQEALSGLTPPANARRVQLIIKSPGYGKSGYRSTGWMLVGDLDLENIEEELGISADDIETVVFDTPND